MTARRQTALLRKAASAFGVEEGVLEDFFPGTSEAFWRGFVPFHSYPWNDVQAAFVKARDERPRKSGVSQKAGWLPTDCTNALNILKLGNGKLLVHGDPNPFHGDSNGVIDLTDERKDDEPVPNGGYPDHFVLQLRDSTFLIYNASLSTLQPGAWLNDDIVNGALHLLQAATNNEVQVIDSLRGKLPAIRTDFRRTKSLLPMQIHGNHWVLGVYEDPTGLLIYDSLPSNEASEVVAIREAKIFLEKISEMNRADPPEVMMTSPLRQTNGYDCGVFAIVAAFHNVMDLNIDPLQIDAALWREVLGRLLSPRPDAHDVPGDAQTIEFPVLPKIAPLAEAPEHLRRLFDELYARTPRDSRAKNRRLRSAKLVLEMAGRLRATASNTGLADAVARFELVERYCESEIRRLREERKVTEMVQHLREAIRERATEPQPFDNVSTSGRLSKRKRQVGLGDTEG
ncbi:hypothetical protein N658DRAFT_501052 [Parathielavia hyrcaniae]|uniref:Ubiquitin-like protease family profile domain-containing protein n=1 Tax=Parathielavia hyrcaniae TaxID=113614 RepID=A0AAN6PWL3_9PEZI|nr:hypothetical protein N658DRAFT_501052 [Parathielavia hyrcaniae]